MGQNLINLLNSFGDLFSSMGVLGGSLFLIGLAFILGIGYIGFTTDWSKPNP